MIRVDVLLPKMAGRVDCADTTVVPVHVGWVRENWCVANRKSQAWRYLRYLHFCGCLPPRWICSLRVRTVRGIVPNSTSRK